MNTTKTNNEPTRRALEVAVERASRRLDRARRALNRARRACDANAEAEALRTWEAAATSCSDARGALFVAERSEAAA